MKKTLLTAVMAAAALAGAAQDSKMDEFVSSLMQKMTIEEKIGQLTLQVAGDITTGSVQSSPVTERIAAGRMGGVFNG